jgi:hypothetical protein
MYKKIRCFDVCHLMRNVILLVTIIDVGIIQMYMGFIVYLWLNHLNEFCCFFPVINENTNNVNTCVSHYPEGLLSLPPTLYSGICLLLYVRFSVSAKTTVWDFR